MSDETANGETANGETANAEKASPAKTAGFFPGHATHVHNVSKAEEISLGRAGDFADMVQPTEPGWVEYASWQAPEETPIHGLSGRVTVPAPPTKEMDQTIFVHLALQSVDTPVTTILSAALQWGVSASGGGNYWTLSCFAGRGRDIWSVPLIEVEPGTVIETGFRRFLLYENPVWEAFAVVRDAQSEENLEETFLRLSLLGEEPALRLVYGGALEAYCDEEMPCEAYPCSDPTSFTDLTLETEGGRPLTPSWEPKVEVAGCGRKVEVVSPSRVDLVYR